MIISIKRFGAIAVINCMKTTIIHVKIQSLRLPILSPYPEHNEPPYKKYNLCKQQKLVMIKNLE